MGLAHIKKTDGIQCWQDCWLTGTWPLLGVDRPGLSPEQFGSLSVV